jgi:hypothetical protein
MLNATKQLNKGSGRIFPAQCAPSPSKQHFHMRQSRFVSLGRQKAKRAQVDRFITLRLAASNSLGIASRELSRWLEGN